MIWFIILESNQKDLAANAMKMSYFEAVLTIIQVKLT